MNTTANPARGLLGNTTTAGRCCENCSRRLRSTFLDDSHCPTCYYVLRALDAAGATTTRDLARASSSAVLWRVADILRRSCVSDAEELIRQLELLAN